MIPVFFGDFQRDSKVFCLVSCFGCFCCSFGVGVVVGEMAFGYVAEIVTVALQLH